MAYRTGARLVNMELVEATLTPLGFSTQGTNSYAGQGAYFLNRHGERFMFKYDAKGEKARRTILVNAVIEEVLAGNEPLYVDIRHLPPESLDDFVKTLGVDRYTLPSYFVQRGLDIRKECCRSASRRCPSGAVGPTSEAVASWSTPRPSATSWGSSVPVTARWSAVASRPPRPWARSRAGARWSGCRRPR